MGNEDRKATAEFRWQAFFQHAAQPIFLLNRRRQILFVNRAWEACTGMTLAEARGRVCRRRSASDDRAELLFSACAPSAEALRGETCQVRRRAPGSAGWWELRFFPLAATEGLLGILGTIKVLAAPAETPLSLPEKLMALRDRQAARYRLEDLGSGAAVLQRLQDQARLASQSEAPTALVGEAGSGKAWLARAIHAASERRQRYFACLDAERLSADQIGEVLFGSRARQLGLGTVHVREAGSLPREWQARLADVLTLRDNADFPRLLIGFCTDPRELIASGRLLEAFHCAASTITLHVPPLRERLAELPRFIEIFLARLASFEAHAVQGVSSEALSVLGSYSWPENLRELQEVLRGACRRAKGDKIELVDLPFQLKHGPLPAERHLPLDTLLEHVERRLMTLAMKLAQDNQTQAAELLEIWRPRLLRRLEKFGILRK